VRGKRRGAISHHPLLPYNEEKGKGKGKKAYEKGEKGKGRKDDFDRLSSFLMTGARPVGRGKKKNWRKKKKKKGKQDGDRQP